MSNADLVASHFLSQTAAVDYSASILSDLTTLIANTASRTVYSQNVYSYDATAGSNGAHQAYLLSSWYWYPYNDPNDSGSGYNETAVDPAIVQRGIDTHGGDAGLRLIEMETWNPYTQAGIAGPNWQLAAKMWQQQTSHLIGFYRLFPDITSNYLPVIYFKDAVAANDYVTQDRWRAIIATWMKQNDYNITFVRDYIDFLCPQCYVQTSGSQTDWQWSIGLQILESTRLAGGKPVYPICWFRAQTSDAVLTESEFVNSLKFILSFPGVSGIYMYSGGTAPVLYTWQDKITEIVNGTGSFVSITG